MRHKEIRNYAFVASLTALLMVLGVTAIKSFSQPDMPAIPPDEDIKRSDFSFAEDYRYGTSANATVHIVLFGDYQCRHTLKSFQIMNMLLDRYGSRISLIYKHMPNVRIHRQALLASLASECAREQGRFLEYSMGLFSSNPDLSYGRLLEIAEDDGINIDRFTDCMGSKRYADKIKGDLEDAFELGLIGTPTVFINGLKLEGVYDLADYDLRIKDEMDR